MRWALVTATDSMMKVGKRSLELADRYPDIHFLLNLTGHKPEDLPELAEELDRWFEQQPSSEIDTLYIIGLTGDGLPGSMEAWLCEKSERVIIFVEQQLAAFAALDQPDLMANPQVHFVYGEGSMVEPLAEQFPSDRVAVFEGAPFDVSALKRRSAAYSTLYSDALYSHKIVDNVLHNMVRLETALSPEGDLSGLPLLICGAGPSLDQAIPYLQGCQNRALILAVGSGITALTRSGITPHIAMAIDPNDSEFSHLSQGRFFEGPFLFSPRLCHSVFSTSNGPYGFLESDTGGLIERYFIEEMGLKGASVGPPLGVEAFSVTTLALSWASSIGFSDIALVGVDLAFSGARRYASDFESDQLNASVSTLDELVDATDLHGQSCQTMTRWIMEANAISQFAAAHPKSCVVSCNGGGLKIDGVKSQPLQSWLHSFQEQDMRGQVHTFFSGEKTAFDRERYQQLLEKLSLSLKRCADLCEAIPTEESGGKKALLLFELQEEEAFRALLDGVDGAVRHLQQRYHPHLDPEAVAKEREVALYYELRRQIALFSRLITHVRD